ncbi:hypothetical protein MLD38_027649 [Melastoma candidum]|uniref:Uncharacterized protein n=1 Tax=Melastoma candidum TaxID=119954 RepID=A0ACB9P6W7_9MYRT|nr:hypothetical protein MLD38_027649 [Melastoma candidum]
MHQVVHSDSKLFPWDEMAVLLTEKVAKAIRPSVVQYDESGFCLSKSGRLHYGGIDRNNAPCLVVLLSLVVASQLFHRRKSCATSWNHSIEPLSLLELIANVVEWEFTQNKIIPSLLSIFSSCISVPIGTGLMVPDWSARKDWGCRSRL